MRSHDGMQPQTWHPPAVILLAAMAMAAVPVVTHGALDITRSYVQVDPKAPPRAALCEI